MAWSPTSSSPGTKGNDSGWIVIATGWGLAVALAVYCVGRISGAHINPAVSVGLWAIGELDAALLPTYIGAQMLGAFLGAVVVWLTYRPHWSATFDQAAKLGVFCTAPEIPGRRGANFITEVVGAAVLVFGVLAIAANASELSGGGIDLSAVFATGINPLLVGFLVWGIGLGLGGPTGYAINPARDLGPRIAHAVLPIPGKGGSDWGLRVGTDPGSVDRGHPRRAGLPGPRLVSGPQPDELHPRPGPGAPPPAAPSCSSAGEPRLPPPRKSSRSSTPSPGHVEHTIRRRSGAPNSPRAQAAIRKAGAEASDLEAIGIANQRETVVLWERDSGKPVANAIVWQSRITAPLCEQLKEKGHEDLFCARTGLVLDPYFSGTKIAHLLDEHDLHARAARGEILAGTIDSFLLWRLTGGKVHATDASNASRTLLFDIHKLDWDDELLEILRVPRAMLPEVRDSSGDFGHTEESPVRSADPDRRHRGRPAGCDLRAGLLRARNVQEHLRHRLLHPDEHGQPGRGLRQRSALHRRLGA